MVAGFVLLLIAGICQGSFGLGYKKYTPFSWAAFWGVYNIMCIISVIGFTWIFAPRLWSVIWDSGIESLGIPVFCGALWGLSAIGFSKGIDKIGMSMVYGISMGISTMVGSVVPMVMNHSYPKGSSAILFLLGLILTLTGVIIVTIAGVKRDGGLKGSSIGYIMAVLSGLGSGAMNVGFTYAEHISDKFKALGYSQAVISSGKWFPVLIGGCFTGLLWCIGEVSVKREWKTVTAKGSGIRAVVLFGVSIVWFAALLLYGLSSKMLGDMGSTTGWILFNALALIISVGWGLKTGEWKHCKKGLLFTGCGVLIVAWIFLAFV